MASVDKVQLIEENLSANKTSDKKTLSAKADKFIATLKISNIASTPSVGGDIEHSLDGTNWESIAAFSGLSSAGFETVQITNGVLPNVRAAVTVSGGSADVDCALWFDPQR